MSDQSPKERPARRREPDLPYLKPMFTRSGLEHTGCIPTQAECAALWNKYGMLPNIREHSSQVALVVAWLGGQLKARGVNVNRPLILAGALLHDIAKSYTIKYGGSHAQLGAGLVVRETGSHRLAQMVYHHVYWPWELDIENEAMLPSLLVLYADKRVKHDRIVTMEERFEDLMERYGVNETARAHIELSREQGLVIEKALCKRLGVGVDEYSFDCRRLV
jgi:putative nucleotidyltransferase with HDIG domain